MEAKPVIPSDYGAKAPPVMPKKMDDFRVHFLESAALCSVGPSGPVIPSDYGAEAPPVNPKKMDDLRARFLESAARDLLFMAFLVSWCLGGDRC